LRTIIAKILERFPDMKLSSKDCKWLGDFYFDARYPGDDFIRVSLQDALEAIKIVEEVLAETQKILVSNEARELFEYCQNQVGK
ncbi:MAG: HEPN domain-containing protein, partial [Cellulosilyticaceae bacterium]